MGSRLLIRDGCVLTQDARATNLSRGDVLVEDGRIAELGQGLRPRDAEVVEAADCIVMPGFVDTHRHAWEALYRNAGSEAGEPDTTLLKPDDLYAATLVGLLGAIEAGITSVVDWCEPAAGPDHLQAAFQAHADSGIRSVFLRTSPFGPGEIAQRGRQTTAAAVSTGGPQSEDEWMHAREIGLRIHVDARSLSRGGVAERRRLLGEDVTLIHCSALDEADLEALASTHTLVSLTPVADMAEGRGTPPIQQLIDRGIRPGLGVESERVAPGDLFAQMRATISLQHATLFDLKLAGKAGIPRLLTTREVIRYATIDGARAAGLGTVTGSIEVGKQADLVVLRADRPNIAPVNDPIGAVVWGMDTSNVDWVFVGGRALMRSGVLDADIARARGLAVAAQHRLASTAGMVAGAAGGEP